MWLIVGTSRSFIWCIVTCYLRLFISYVHSFCLYKEHIHNMYAQFLCMTLFPCNKWSFRSTSLLFHRVYTFCSLDNKVGESPRTMEQVLPVCSPAAQHTCPCGRSRDRWNPPCAREGVEAVTDTTTDKKEESVSETVERPHSDSVYSRRPVCSPTCQRNKAPSR